MGNVCCRRVGYSPNGTEVDNGRCPAPEPLPQSQKGALMSYHSAGDDCAINELLEGRMDLDVFLPDGRKVKLTVERRTPMMDLLVQAASATKISPAGHTIHVFGDDPKGGTLPYKPSTPIGSLDANTICIVSKKDSLDAAAKRNKAAARPFEPTFRVQVHLPRNQLTVVRVSPRSKISELRDMVCREKGLDTSKYQLVRPTSRGQALEGCMTLSEYGATEIALLSNACIESHICNSTSHIIPYSKRVEEQKKKTGILRLLAEDSNQKAPKKEPSPVPPPPVTTQPLPCRYKPKKRRPAPPPPFHSRQSSSDSSGYHEATSSSLLQHQPAPIDKEEKAGSDSSGVSSLDAKVAELKGALKKRKAPPPPKEDHVNETEDLAPHVPDPVPFSENRKDNSPLPPEESTEESSEEVTRVALAALSARLEQDVTQREIACSIQAAFHSLDGDQRPSLLAIKQRSSANKAADGDVTDETLLAARSSDEGSPAGDLGAEETVVPQLGCTVTTESSETVSGGKQSVEKTVVSQPECTKLKTGSRDSLSGGKQSVEKTGASEPEAGFSVTNPTTQRLVGPSANSENSAVTDKASVGSSSSDKTVVGRIADKASLSVGVTSSAKQDVLRQFTDNLIETECVAPSTLVSQELSARDQKLDKSSVSSKSKQAVASTVTKQLQIVASASAVTKQPQTVASATSVTKQPQTVASATAVTKQPSVEHQHGRISNRSVESKTSNKPPTLQNSSNVPSKGRSADTPSVHSIATTKQSSTLTRRPSNPEPSREPNGRHVILSTDVPIHGRKAAEASSYPLQKSTARLNFDDDDDPFQSFPPPPSQFRNPEVRVSDDPIPCPPNFRSTTPLRRSSSMLNISDDSATTTPTPNRYIKKSRNLQRSLSDLSTPGDDPEAEFEVEQQRLQREYIKLQRQFVLWQQQLLSNHAMLRDECIVPQYARTLRQSHSLPEGGDDDRTPLVSRSLSYEPSTLPRSTINIPPLEFGSGTIKNGSNTLRSSKTKSYFKPPQVRVSTKNRQRLPPEIRNVGDMDVYDDTKILSTILPSFDSLKLIAEDSSDLDIGNLILKPTGKVEKKSTSSNSEVHHQKPSFFNNVESKKIPNGKNMESKLTNGNTFGESKKILNGKNMESKLTNGNMESKLTNGNMESRKFPIISNKEGSLKKVPPPVPNKTSFLPKTDAMTRVNNERNRDSSSENVPISNGVPPPPPPPAIEKVGVAKVASKKVEKKVFTPQLDPREQLMQEIRKCGGRTALRKISLDIPS